MADGTGLGKTRPCPPHPDGQARARWRNLLDAVSAGDTDVVMIGYEDDVTFQAELQRLRTADAALTREWAGPEEDATWREL